MTCLRLPVRTGRVMAPTRCPTQLGSCMFNPTNQRYSRLQSSCSIRRCPLRTRRTLAARAPATAVRQQSRDDRCGNTTDQTGATATGTPNASRAAFTALRSTSNPRTPHPRDRMRSQKAPLQQPTSSGRPGFPCARYVVATLNRAPSRLVSFIKPRYASLRAVRNLTGDTRQPPTLTISPASTRWAEYVVLTL